jgi:hypothetical protein
MAEQMERSRGRSRPSGDDPDQRRLSGTIWAQKGQSFAGT